MRWRNVGHELVREIFLAAHLRRRVRPLSPLQLRRPLRSQLRWPKKRPDMPAGKPPSRRVPRRRMRPSPRREAANASAAAALASKQAASVANRIEGNGPIKRRRKPGEQSGDDGGGRSRGRYQKSRNAGIKSVTGDGRSHRFAGRTNNSDSQHASAGISQGRRETRILRKRQN